MRRAGRISGAVFSEQLRGDSQVGDEFVHPDASFVVGSAQDRRGVHGCDDRWQVAGRIVHDAAAAQDAELRSQERLRSDRTHQDEHVGGDDVDLGAQPGRQATTWVATDVRGACACRAPSSGSA